MIKTFNELKNNAVKSAIALMAASAKTAPKSKGKDDLEIIYLDGVDLKKAINYMSSDKFIKETTKKKEYFIDSDIETLKKALGVFAIGIKTKSPLMMNCGKCGCKDCSEFTQMLKNGKDVNCIFKILDLGFAVSSACKTASDLNIDNRVMYDIGEAIRKTYMKKCDIVLGISISIKGNNIFFDRYLKFFIDKARKEKTSLDELLKQYRIKIN